MKKYFYLGFFLALNAFAIGVGALAPNAMMSSALESYRLEFNSTASVGYISNMYEICAYGSGGEAMHKPRTVLRLTRKMGAY